MVRLSRAAVAAATTFGVVSARLTANDVLTFNLSLPLTAGFIRWSGDTPLGGQDMGAWVVTFDGIPANENGWGQEGEAEFTVTSDSFDNKNPPSCGFKLPVEAAYWDATFDAPPGGEKAVKIWVGNTTNDNIMKDDNPDNRRSAGGYLRVYEGLPPFSAADIQFGLSGYTGGGTLKINGVKAQLSMVTKAPTFQDALSAADNRVFSPGRDGRVDDTIFSCSDTIYTTFDVLESGGSGYATPTFARDSKQMCTITVPQNTSMVYLNGTTDSNSGGMLVRWDPPLPDGMDKNLTSKDVRTNTSYVRRNELLVLQTLDPRIEYKLIVTGDGKRQTGNISLYGATFFKAEWNGQFPTYNDVNVVETPPHPEAQVVRRSNKGAIIGGIIGGTLGALCIAGLAIWLCIGHRRRTSQSSVATEEETEKGSLQSNGSRISPFVASYDRNDGSSDVPLSEIPSSPTFITRSRDNTGTCDSDWTDDDIPSSVGDYGSLNSPTIASETKSPPPSSVVRRPPMPRREVISELDAGSLEPITDSDQVEYEYIPPLYNPEWAGSISGRNRARSAMGSSTLGANSLYDTPGSIIEEQQDPLSETSESHGTLSYTRTRSDTYSSARSHQSSHGHSYLSNQTH